MLHNKLGQFRSPAGECAFPVIRAGEQCAVLVMATVYGQDSIPLATLIDARSFVLAVNRTKRPLAAKLELTTEGVEFDARTLDCFWTSCRFLGDFPGRVDPVSQGMMPFRAHDGS